MNCQVEICLGLHEILLFNNIWKELQSGKEMNGDVSKGKQIFYSKEIEVGKVREDVAKGSRRNSLE